MPKSSKKFLSYALLLVMGLAVFCELPTDPAEDINALKATINIENLALGIFQDIPVTFKISINFPKHTKSLTVKFDENGILDTVFKSSRPGSTENETFFVYCTYKTTGKRKITLDIERSDGSFAKFYSDEFVVNDRKPNVEFITTPSNKISFVKEPDTLHFVAQKNIPTSVISFTCKTTPALTSEYCRVISNGDTAKVIIIPQEQTNYTVHCYAGVVNAVDTAEVEITTLLKPVMSSMSGLSDLKIGTTDTILFVKQAGSSQSFEMLYVNTQNYDTNLVKVISSKQDTLSILFQPVEAKTYTFSLLVKKDSLLDTITFQKVVTGTPITVWKQTSTTINIIEGKQLSYPLSSHLIDPAATDITFSSSKGTIDNKTVKYAVPWGSAPKDSIQITAMVNGTASQFNLIFNVAPTDISAPKLKLITPATNPFKINDSKVTCKFTAEDSGAGIGSVIITKNGTVITDINKTDSLYQCTIDNLVDGVPVTVKIVVIDASMRKNRDSITVSITRDITMEDKNPPTITLVADPRKSGRVTVDTGTIKVSIEDGSGIADNGVIAKLNGTALTGVTKSGTVYSIPYKLVDYGPHTISILATDNSAAKNIDSLPVKIDYNTTISTITAIAPKLDSTKVALQPTFSWSGGDDADKDTVFYKVLYGTDSLALSSQTAVVSQKSLTTSAVLVPNTKYFWNVIGYSIKYPDTVKSSVMYFTTLNNDNSGPSITYKSGTANGSRVKVASGEIVVTVTDPNGVQGVSATLNGTLITGLTSSGSDYTIPYTLTSFGNNTIVITGKDNSADHNSNSITIAFTYNTSPSLLALVSPADNAQEIDTFPTIKWTGGSDADGDTVLFKVRYGTSATALTSQTPEYANVSEIKFTTKLSTNTTYYWSVIGNSKKISNDSVVLGPYSFKTVNLDRTTPIITLVTPASYTEGMVVSSASGTIAFTATDGNGIDSVYYKINNGTKTAITGSGPQYSFTYNFATFGTNTVKLYAIDKSAERNRDSATFTFNYKTKPSAIELTTPANEATDIDTLPTFTWTGGDDADGDPVSYRVLYGTSVTTLTSQSAVATTKTVKLTSKLATNRTYYWKVIAYNSTTLKDTTSSETYSLTTANPDRTFPTLNITAPTPYTAGMRVTTAANSITFTASDANGIDSAYYTINATGTKRDVTATSGTYTFAYTLTRRGLDTITISVVDGSAQKNKTTTQVIVNFNTVLPEDITVTAPVNNKTDVPLLPAFTWTALTDADGDAISYKVKYSMNSALPSGSSMTSAVTGTTVTITLGNILAANTTYYYQVIGYTSSPFVDSAKSEIRTFTTVAAPTITRQPVGESVVVGSPATFSVGASGTGLTYQWQRGTTPISGETSSSYTIDQTKSSDNGAQFRCLVTSAGGSVTSDAATLTIQYTVTYNGNNNSSGTVPAVVNYQTGATVTVAAQGTLARTNYTFGGWSDGVTNYSAGQMFRIGTSNVTLTAVWTSNPRYTVTYMPNGALGGTVPAEQQFLEGDYVTVAANSGSLVRRGYVFTAWNTQADGKGTDYPLGLGTFQTGKSNVRLFAKWEIKDASGNTYTEVKIGNQVWLAQNLKTKRYNDGTEILPWSDTVENELGKYKEGEAFCGNYYNGDAVRTGKLAPDGWHVSTDEDWQILISTIKNNASIIASKTDWQTSTTPGAVGNNSAKNDSTGFNALPAGNWEMWPIRWTGYHLSAQFWTNRFHPEENQYYGLFYYLAYDNETVEADETSSYSSGRSVRLVRDY